ncbi:extensin-like [Thrips palmi]|uniref:Extensin-like n=1 Tax=Thrips palmi TaxID=161013 RepID=A0A6P8ZUJ8_THRPL|nr:extensin-like [Thrips palmi]
MRIQPPVAQSAASTAVRAATQQTSKVSSLTPARTDLTPKQTAKFMQPQPSCSRATSQPTFMRTQPPVSQSAASTAVRAATQPTSKVSSLTPARTDLTPKQTAKFMQPQPSCSKATPQPTFMRIQASVAQSAASTAVSASSQPRIPISLVRLTAQPTATVSTLTPVRTALQNTPRQTVQVMQPQPSCSRATPTPKSKFLAKPAAKIPAALSVVRSTAQPSSMRIQPPVAQLPTSTPERDTAQPTFVRIQSGPSTPIRTPPVPIPHAPVKVSTPSAPAVSLPSSTPMRPMKRLVEPHNLPLEPLPAKVQKSYENRTVRSNPVATSTPVKGKQYTHHT